MSRSVRHRALVISGCAWVGAAGARIAGAREVLLFEWATAAALTVLTLLLAILIFLELKDYVEHRLERRRAGERLLTSTFLHRFLLIGLGVSVLFRIDTFEEIPAAISVGPLWLFAVGLAIFYLVQWRRRGATPSSG